MQDLIKIVQAVHALDLRVELHVVTLGCLQDSSRFNNVLRRFNTRQNYNMGAVLNSLKNCLDVYTREKLLFDILPVVKIREEDRLVALDLAGMRCLTDYDLSFLF